MELEHVIGLPWVEGSTCQLFVCMCVCVGHRVKVLMEALILSFVDIHFLFHCRFGDRAGICHPVVRLGVV